METEQRSVGLERRRVSRGLEAVAVFAAGLFFIAAPASAATNLVKNGGFEQPVVSPGSFLVFSTGQSFASWSVVGAAGNVAVVSGTFTQGGFTFPAKAGKQWLDLTGTSQTATGVAQTVATTPGHTYTLSFAVGNVVDPGGIFGISSTVDVLVNGRQILTATNSRGQGSTKQVWKTFRATFKATSRSTVIAFLNGDPSNDTQNGLDAVSLT